MKTQLVPIPVGAGLVLSVDREYLSLALVARLPPQNVSPIRWLARTSLGVLASISVSVGCLLPQASLAQTADNQPLVDFNNQQNQDLFSNKNNGDSFGVFDLIHRAQLGNIRDVNEYSSEQRQNLNDAAADFRRQQLQRLRNPASPARAVKTTPPGN